ncbi:hypothetical protein BST28156_05639 [Burkholderia stagnalis]|nr:hypothetical protein BST28156_05639 [Burkholderia stagnalis]
MATTDSSSTMKFVFHKVESPEKVPAGIHESRFTVAEHAQIQAAFQNQHPAKNPQLLEKQPCHIITCSVTGDETVCWYHCIK